MVDGEWKYDPNQPAMFDKMGNVNVVTGLHDYVPGNLKGLPLSPRPLHLAGE